MAAAPESDSGPPPPLFVLVVVPVSVTHSLSMTSRPCPCVRALARTVACRRRALEAVEKAHYIRWVVALRENPGRCGSGRAGAAAALRLGFVLGWGLAGWDGMGGLPVTPDNFGMRTR